MWASAVGCLTPLRDTAYSFVEGFSAPSGDLIVEAGSCAGLRSHATWLNSSESKTRARVANQVAIKR